MTSDGLRATGQLAILCVVFALGVVGGLVFIPLLLLSLFTAFIGFWWLALVYFAIACAAARLAVNAYETGTDPRWPAFLEAIVWAASIVGGISLFGL